MLPLSVQSPGMKSSPSILFFCLATMLASSPRLFSQAQEPSPFGDRTIEQLTANDVLRLVRYSYTLYNQDFQARLRVKRFEEPFVLSLQPSSIRFIFNSRTIQLDTKNDQFLLKEKIGEVESSVPPERYSERIAGTDVTFEDLSMRFLYWPSARILREEKVKTRETWLVRARNPEAVGPYATVDVWIDKGSGAMMQMWGYDAAGKRVKEFEVDKGKKIGDVWMISSMSVKTIDPASGKKVSETSLEVLDTAKPQP